LGGINEVGVQVWAAPFDHFGMALVVGVDHRLPRKLPTHLGAPVALRYRHATRKCDSGIEMHTNNLS